MVEMAVTEPEDVVVFVRQEHAAPLDDSLRKALIDSVQASAAFHKSDGPNAARSQDFLYGGDGLPA
jgi:hypothetical protein